MAREFRVLSALEGSKVPHAKPLALCTDREVIGVPFYLMERIEGFHTELFYIITKGKGKMMAEGDRVPEKLRWNLVNLVRSLAAKGAEQKSAAAGRARRDD